MNPLQDELKALIVSALELEDVTAEEIDSAAPLFGEGLGLDSIDALELAVALSKKYGVTLQAEDEKTRAVCACVDSRARYIEEHRAA